MCDIDFGTEFLYVHRDTVVKPYREDEKTPRFKWFDEEGLPLLVINNDRERLRAEKDKTIY